jgi:ketosteroid isomerase-like protein
MNDVMKRILMGVGLVVACAGGAATVSETKGETEIAAIDKSWGEAYVSCDVKAWAALLADDLVFVHNSGVIDDKAKQMNSIAGCGIESLSTQTTTIRLYGNDTAVVVGAMKGKMKGGNFTFDLLYTRVYIKQNGTWRLVSHQSTDAPKKKAS